jgi:hypothetical protein
MAELRVQIPDDLVQKLQDRLGAGTKVTDMAREAFTLFNWAVSERAQGRVVLSSDKDGDNINKLAMPSLDRVKEGS